MKCSKLTTKSHSEDVPEISEQKNIIEKIPYNSHQLIEKIAVSFIKLAVFCLITFSFIDNIMILKICGRITEQKIIHQKNKSSLLIQ